MKPTHTYLNAPINRDNDLSPRGVKSTIKGEYSFNEVFSHIYKEIKK